MESLIFTKYYIEINKKSAFRNAMPDCSINSEIIAATFGNDAGSMDAASLVFKSLPIIKTYIATFF